MNKEAVKTNLKKVFFREKKLKEARQVYLEAIALKENAEDNLRDVRGFLRKSIDDSEEVYVVNIDGKDYKIMSDKNDSNDVLIEEIELIK